jgi:hypothetical protein
MNSNFFNLSKRKKRDLLLELLLGKDGEGIVSKKELNALHRLLDEHPAGRAPDKTKKRQSGTKKGISPHRSPKQKTIKTTHYLLPETVKNLTRAQEAIRSSLPEHMRSKISKSQIVDTSLSIILQEFSAKGKNSRLMRRITQKT